MKAGELIECQVVGFQDYGIFVTYNEYEGLIHISEISDRFVTNISDIFEIGESLLVVVLEVDEGQKRLKLSYKQAHEINQRILKEVPIIKGFSSLKLKLNDWIKEEREKSNMALLKLDLTNAQKFINEDFKSYEDQVSKIHNQIHEKTGLGNDYLGWIELPNQAINSALVVKAKQLREISDVLVVVGIGGSYLGAKAGIEFLTKPFANEEKEVIFAGHHLSGEYLARLVNYLKDKRFAINVISKSGTTTEPAVAFRVLKKLAEEKYKNHAHKYIVATTDQSRGALYELATQKGYTKFVIPDDVGGRYSVLTPVGLLPFLYKGYDVDKMMFGAKKAYQDFSDSDLNNNLAYQYALSRYLLYKSGKKIEILGNYEPRLTYFSEWWKQLYGESEGKDNKGLFVASVSFTSDLHSMGQYIQEGERHLFETILDVEKMDEDLVLTKEEDDLDGLNYLEGKTVFEVNKQALKGTMMAHVEGGVPNILISIKDLSEETFGYLIYFFEIATAMSAYLLDVNPFNQPGVEAYKTKMFALLGKKGYEDVLK